MGVFEIFEMSTHPGYSRVKIGIIHNSCIFLKLAPMQHLRDKIRLPIICKLAKQRKRVEQIELQGWCRKLSYTTLTCFLITSVYCQREAKRLVITRIC